jgi:hypothetical protein
MYCALTLARDTRRYGARGGGGSTNETSSITMKKSLARCCSLVRTCCETCTRAQEHGSQGHEVAYASVPVLYSAQM